jgi:hypothetical protein
MTLAAAAPLTPGRGRAGRDVLAELGGHPAQDAAADLAGIRPAPARAGEIGVGGTAEGHARARQQTVPTRRTLSGVGSGAGAVALSGVRSRSHFSPGFPCGPLHCGDHSQDRSVSSPRRIEPCVRFSRTRLTDAVHRRHSA